METIHEKQTIIVYTYRYIWKTKDDKLHCKFITEPQEGHRRFQQMMLEDDSVVSCIREYMHEINFEYLGFTEPVKQEKKVVDENAEDVQVNELNKEN